MNKYLISILLFAYGNLFAQKETVSLLSFDFTDGVQVKLPKELRETSGLSCSADGRVFTHNDEAGIVFQIDIKTGKIIKKFSLGPQKVYDDFEGIAIVEKTFYLVASNGTIYEFSEGENNNWISYKKYSTFLTEQDNVEGLCYDQKTNALLLACKGHSSRFGKAFKTIFSFSIDTKRLNETPRFLLPLNELRSKASNKKIHPSGMEVNLIVKTFFILDSKTPAIFEISSMGKILHCVRLSRKLHGQPEGITFISEGSLIISDEGKNEGMLTVYRRKNR